MLEETKKKYLFIIYELGNQGKSVRGIDIAKALGVKKASVSLMLPKLISEEMIERSEDGSIVFTQKGAVFAGELYLTYLILFRFFRGNLGSSLENARRDAVCCLCSLIEENAKRMTDFILQKI